MMDRSPFLPVGGRSRNSSRWHGGLCNGRERGTAGFSSGRTGSTRPSRRLCLLTGSSISTTFDRCIGRLRFGSAFGSGFVHNNIIFILKTCQFHIPMTTGRSTHATSINRRFIVYISRSLVIKVNVQNLLDSGHQLGVCF